MAEFHNNATHFAYFEPLNLADWDVWSSRVLDKSAAFGGEPDIFDIFKLMLGEGNKRFNNPLRRLLRPKVYIPEHNSRVEVTSVNAQRQLATLNLRNVLPCKCS